VKTSIIFNPVAGARKRKKLTRALGAFKAQGISPIIRETQKRGDACNFAQEEIGRGSEIIVAAGGDGTINEVANGIAGTGARLGILPMGLANVLALEMSIPDEPESAVNVIIRGIPQLINPGYVMLTPSGSVREVKRYFLLMAGIGLDGGVMHDISRSHIERWGRTAYVIAGMRALATYTGRLFTIRMDGRNEIDAYSAVVGKSRFYGGRFMVTPRASLKDECLDVCAFKGKGSFSMLKQAVAILIGGHPGKTGAYYEKARELEITSEDTVYVQVDGDFLGSLPARFGVHNGAMSIMAPEKTIHADDREQGKP
jgi:YegS/Rv2252/BmrU family lipid kinase